MKTRLCISVALLAGAVAGMAQNQNTNSPGLEGTARGQVPAQAQVARPSPQSGVVLRERQYYYGGVVNDVAKGRILAPPRYSNPRDPVQNPAVDLMTRKPRGVVLWSWNF